MTVKSNPHNDVKEFENNLETLLKDICANLSAAEPTDKFYHKLDVWESGVNNDCIAIKRYDSFFKRTTVIEFDVCAYDKSLNVRILDKYYKKACQKALKKHESNFDEIQINYGKSEPNFHADCALSPYC